MSSPASSRRSLLALLLAAPAALLVRPVRAMASLDPQPHMREALASLRLAKVHLDKATPDKGGHRVKALALVQDAIRETEAGIQFDNRH